MSANFGIYNLSLQGAYKFLTEPYSRSVRCFNLAWNGKDIELLDRIGFVAAGLVLLLIPVINSVVFAILKHLTSSTSSQPEILPNVQKGKVNGESLIRNNFVLPKLSTETNQVYQSRKDDYDQKIASYKIPASSFECTQFLTFDLNKMLKDHFELPTLFKGVYQEAGLSDEQIKKCEAVHQKSKELSSYSNAPVKTFRNIYHFLDDLRFQNGKVDAVQRKALFKDTFDRILGLNIADNTFISDLEKIAIDVIGDYQTANAQCSTLEEYLRNLAAYEIYKNTGTELDSAYLRRLFTKSQDECKNLNHTLKTWVSQYYNLPEDRDFAKKISFNPNKPFDQGGQLKEEALLYFLEKLGIFQRRPIQ